MSFGFAFNKQYEPGNNDTIRVITGRGKLKDMMNKLNQTTCKRCGRKLKNGKAIEIGMGAICWKKYQQENNHKKLWKARNNYDIE